MDDRSHRRPLRVCSKRSVNGSDKVNRGVGCVIDALETRLQLAAAATGVLPAWDTQPDTWVATDALGRATPVNAAVGNVKSRSVGSFYFLWEGQHTQQVYDNTKILAANPTNPTYGPANAYHYWGEPVFGYYRQTDPYVIRKQLQMLGDAGVDFIAADMTNGLTYRPVYTAVLGVMRDMLKSGAKVPKFVPFTSSAAANTLWTEFLSKNEYRDCWYEFKGKPLIMLKGDDPGTFPAGITGGDFTVRYSWAWNGPWFGNGQNKWPWIQTDPNQFGWSENSTKPEEMSASVASHPTLNLGRSYANGVEPPPSAQHPEQGLRFADQWNAVLAKDPEVAFVTGWNEWIAQRTVRGASDPAVNFLGQPVPVGGSYFVDNYNQEFSRDIEPMKGGHGDNYYMQLVSNIRKFKGARSLPDVTPNAAIGVDGVFNDWQIVGPEYRDDFGDPASRDDPGLTNVGWGGGAYTNSTGRNDLVAAKVTYDASNVYFYARTRDDISPSTDANWMMLYLNTDGNAATGWMGYDYVLNRTNGSARTSTTTTLQQYAGTAGSYAWTNASTTIPYRVNGNEIEVSIPRSTLGVTTTPTTVDFKWADNIQQTGDWSEFTLNGDVAPNNRFSYRAVLNGGATTALPAPWDSADVGTVNARGSATVAASGAITLTSRGDDIGGTSDQYRGVHQILTGDGELIVRVDALSNTDPFAKAGVMVRESLKPDAKYVGIFTTASNGTQLQVRTANGATTGTAGGVAGQAFMPIWLRVRRVGNVVYADRSADGVTWTNVGGGQSVAMTPSVYLTIAQTSGSTTASGSATVSNVAFTTALDSGWSTADVGTVTRPGAAAQQDDPTALNRFILSGNGSDILGTADAMRLVYRTLTGDGELIARVARLDPTDPDAKAGLVIRESLAADAKYVGIVSTAGNGTQLQVRSATGGTTATAGGVAGQAFVPQWLRVRRVGTNLFVDKSPDGTTWTNVGGAQSVAMGTTVYVGMVQASHATATGQAQFDDVIYRNALPTGWTNAQIGTSSGPSGASYDGGTFRISNESAGASGNADDLGLTYQRLTGDFQIVTRLDELDSSDPFASAGLMARDTLAATSRHVSLIVSAGRGMRLTLRSAVGGGTATNGTTRDIFDAPVWLRIRRTGNAFFTDTSPDGVTWTNLGGSQGVAMASTIYVGMTASGANNARPSSAAFSNVAVNGVVVTTPPTAPGALAGELVSAGSAKLTWTDNALDETSYGVDYTTDPTFAAVIGTKTFAANSTSAVVDGLNTGTTYYFRTRAINAAGSSAPSDTTSVTTLFAGDAVDVADTFVRDLSTEPDHAIDTTLTTKTSSGINRIAYLKFDLAPVSPRATAVTLRLFGGIAGTPETSLTAGIYSVADTTWNEAGMTNATKPEIDSLLGTVVAGTTATQLTLDVTAAVQAALAAGQRFLAVAIKNTTTSSASISFNSREAAVNRPVLLVTAPDASSPTLIAAASRKRTQSAQDLDHALPLTAPAVESRSGGVTQLVLNFSEPVIPSDGLLDANEFVISGATFVSASMNGSSMILSLTGAVDRSIVSVQLQGLADVNGNGMASGAAISVNNLAGDVNGDRSVNFNDFLRLQNAFGRSVGAAGYDTDCDLNADGSVDFNDFLTLQNSFGNSF